MNLTNKRLRSFLTKWEAPIWWGIVVGAFIYSTIYGGLDWVNYRSATLGDYTTHPYVGNPTYIVFLFWPLAYWLPANVGAAVVVLLNLLSINWVSKITGVNRWLIIFSYPALWIIKMAQTDGLILLGVCIGWWAIKHNKPYWQGVATLLLFLKPQTGIPIALVYLIWQRNWRSLVISTSVIVASFAVFGFWPIPWLDKLFSFSRGITTGGNFATTGNSIDLFPYGLLFFLVPLLPFYTRKERITAIIAASMLSVPYAGYYSIIAAMAFSLPIWVYVMISLPLLGTIGWWAILGPLSLLLYPTINKLFEIFRKRLLP